MIRSSLCSNAHYEISGSYMQHNQNQHVFRALFLGDQNSQAQTTQRKDYPFTYLGPSRLLFKALALWADGFYKSKCPSVCRCVCVFTFEVQFKRLFAPTSRSRMSNIFRDSVSLGKSNGKKWSQI